jgi:cytosine/adenosine deaminase-related metal-dependent hydrolase
MMNRKISADLLFYKGKWKTGLAIEVSDQGKIIQISDDLTDCEFFAGALVPGWINAHCHLELSNLEGRIPPHTGMAGFIQKLATVRPKGTNGPTAIHSQLQIMYNRGIRGIGDISNDTSTFALKQKGAHPMRFFTFVELFGLDPNKAQYLVESGIKMSTALPSGEASVSWHAPYSMSAELIEKIGALATINNQPLNLHLLESSEEVQLFSSGTGPLADFLKHIGITPLPDRFGKGDVLDFLLPLLPKEVPILLVHVTELQPAQLERLRNSGLNISYCLCPGANLYIHNKLPPADLFDPTRDRVMLGTDSLAGNWHLDILEEIKLLSKHFPTLSTETLMYWATQAGADFWGWQDLGEFEVGKQPGILGLTGLQNGRIYSDTQITVLA